MKKFFYLLLILAISTSLVSCASRKRGRDCGCGLTSDVTKMPQHSIVTAHGVII